MKEFVIDVYNKKPIENDTLKNDLLEFSKIGSMKFPNEL